MSEHRGAITHEGERYPSPRARPRYSTASRRSPGTRVQVGERLWWARIPLPMELNHINVWLHRRRRRLDAGRHRHGRADACREAWGTLEAQHLGGRPLRRMFITHDHPDHMGLSPWLAVAPRRRGVDVGAFAHRVGGRLSRGGARRRCASARMHSAFSNGMHIALGRRRSARPRRAGATTGSPAAAARGRACVDGDTLDGRRPPTGDLIETDGHCRGHLCLHDAAGEVLISGDQVLPAISPNVSVISSRPDADPLREFLASLARLEQCAADTLVLPSHGRPFRGLHRRIADCARTMRTHHRQQLAALVAACSRAAPAVRAAAGDVRATAQAASTVSSRWARPCRLHPALARRCCSARSRRRRRRALRRPASQAAGAASMDGPHSGPRRPQEDRLRHLQDSWPGPAAARSGILRNPVLLLFRAPADMQERYEAAAVESLAQA